MIDGNVERIHLLAHSRGTGVTLSVLRDLRLIYKHDAAAPENGYWPLAYMNSYGFTISGGSNEIQRNILGERILGMPKSK